MERRISLHPYIAAFFELISGLVLLWALLNASTLYAVGLWFLLRTGITVALVTLVYCPPPLKRLPLLFSFLFAQIGFSLTILLLDQRLITLAAGIGAVVLSAFVYALLPAKAPELSFSFKPARRARLMLSMLGIFGLWSTLFALSTLQLLHSFQFIMLWLLAIVLSTVVAFWWWYEYGISPSNKIWVSTLAMLLLTLETSGFLWWWPIGYLAAAFLMVWWWYIVWLMIRFHLTEEGIVLRKQIPFLIGNSLACLLYILLVIRWK